MTERKTHLCQRCMHTELAVQGQRLCDDCKATLNRMWIRAMDGDLLPREVAAEVGLSQIVFDKWKSLLICRYRREVGGPVTTEALLEYVRQA